MKNYSKVMLAWLAMAFSIGSFSQVVVVDYMKVKPGNVSKYLAIENEWKKIHEARIKAGFITGWALYENMFSGADDPFQYATVTSYKNLAAYENSWSDSIVRTSYPDFKEKDWNEFFERTEASRVLSNTKVFSFVDGISAKDPNLEKYLLISTMQVKPGGEDNYVKMEKTLFKPMHQEIIKTGGMEAWSIWQKNLGSTTDYQYVAVNSFASLEQMDKGDYGKAMAKALPGKTAAEVFSKMYAARLLTETYLFRRLDLVSK